MVDCPYDERGTPKSTEDPYGIRLFCASIKRTWQIRPRSSTRVTVGVAPAGTGELAVSFGGAAETVGNGDVPVHGYRGFDAAVGSRSGRDAGRASPGTTSCCARTIDAHDGVVFATGGDGFAVAFHRVADALAAAADAQRALRDEGLSPVRMGIHTGEAVERDGDYFGPTVNRAARLMAIGHGGQVLVSHATEQLIRDSLPDGVALVDLGEHRLRDLSSPERVFQLCVPGLASEFRAAAFARCAAHEPSGAVDELRRPRRRREGRRRPRATSIGW